MKLKWRLDLNTIIVILLIVIFSGILYIHFRKSRFIEGLPSSLQEATTDLTTQQATLDEYKGYKTSFDSVMQNMQSQTKKVSNEDRYIKNVTRQVSPSVIIPDLNVMGNQLAGSQTILAGYTTTINDIKIKLGLTSTVNTDVSSAIQNKINNQTYIRDQAKLAIENLIKFSIDETKTIVGERSAIVTINSSSLSPPPIYTITSTPLATTISTTSDTNSSPGNTIITINGLTNNTSYVFKVTADYGDKITYIVSTKIPIIPRTKPVITVIGGTGYADISIVPSSDSTKPTGYSITKNDGIPRSVALSESTGPIRFDGLTNNIPCTFMVVANYDNGKSLPSSIVIIPRDSPTGTGKFANGSAILTIIAPTGVVAPTSYLVSGYKTLISNSKLSIQSVPDTTLPVSFTGLTNNTEYTFSITAKYWDDSISSPFYLKGAPKFAPTPTASVTGYDGSATLVISQPTGVPVLKNYNVRVYKKGTSSDVYSSTSNKTTRDINSLRNGVTYIISVVAIYQDGAASDKVENEVTPTRPRPNIQAIRTTENIVFYIANPTSTMKSFSIFQKDGKVNKNKRMTSDSMSDKLSLGPYLVNEDYHFDIDVNYTDGAIISSKNARYFTLKEPNINATAAKNSITFNIIDKDGDTSNMESFSMTCKKPKTTKSGLINNAITFDGLNKNTEYKFDIVITYKNGITRPYEYDTKKKTSK